MIKIKTRKEAHFGEIDTPAKGTFGQNRVGLRAKSGQRIEEKEDFDFDFSVYEQDEDQEDKFIDNIIKQKDNIHNITSRRSKFSMGLDELKQLADLSFLMKKYGIKVEERRQDIKELWKLYGAISEFWACIRDMFGKLTIDEVTTHQDQAYKALKDHRSGRIDFSVHEKLLEFRKIVYRARHFTNLSIETEKRYRGEYAKASALIKQ